MNSLFDGLSANHLSTIQTASTHHPLSLSCQCDCTVSTTSIHLGPNEILITQQACLLTSMILRPCIHRECNTDKAVWSGWTVRLRMDFVFWYAPVPRCRVCMGRGKKIPFRVNLVLMSVIVTLFSSFVWSSFGLIPRSEMQNLHIRRIRKKSETFL